MRRSRRTFDIGWVDAHDRLTHRRLATTAAIGFLFGQNIARSGAGAPRFVTGLVTFLIMFGTGVAPLFDEPSATLTQRLFNIGLACTYAFLVLALIDTAMRRERPPTLPSTASAIAPIRES
jgi:hypothetical protein